MAKETVGDLYLSLGIDLSKLESDYLKADETVSQNMKRLQDQIKSTRLQIKVDTGDINLSEADKLLKLQQDINTQIDLQKEKVELATAAWRAEVQATNEESAAAQKLQQNMMREQINLNGMQSKQRSADLALLASQRASAIPAAAEEGASSRLADNAGLIETIIGTSFISPIISAMQDSGWISTAADITKKKWAESFRKAPIDPLKGLEEKDAELNAMYARYNAIKTAMEQQPGKRFSQAEAFKEMGMEDDQKARLAELIAQERVYSQYQKEVTAELERQNSLFGVMSRLPGNLGRFLGSGAGDKYADSVYAERMAEDRRAIVDLLGARHNSRYDVYQQIGDPELGGRLAITGKELQEPWMEDYLRNKRMSMVPQFFRPEYDLLRSGYDKMASIMPTVDLSGVREKLRTKLAALGREISQSKLFSIIPDIKLSDIKSKLAPQMAVIANELKQSSAFSILPNINFSGVKKELASQMGIIANELKQSQILSIVPHIKMPDLSALNGIKSKFAEVGQSLGSGALKTGSEAASKAMEYLLSVFGRVFKLAGLAVVFAAVGEAIVKLAHPAIEAGENIYRLQQHMHATSQEAVQFNNIFKVAGGSSEQALTSLMRLDKTIRKAGQGGNEATRALAAFGVSLQDSNGALLPYNQQLEKLAEGYQKAKAAGLEEEYVTSTLGVRGRELVSVLEDYTELQEKANSIQSTGLLNPEVAHKLSVESNLLSAEWSQLGTAFSAALQPAASEILPALINLLKSSVALIADHKDAIFAVSMALGKLVALGIDFLSGCIKLLNGVCNLIGLIADGIFRLTASLEGFNSPAVDAFYEKLKKIVEMTGNAKGFNPIDMDAQKQALAMMNGGGAGGGGAAANGNRIMTDSHGNSYNLGPDPAKQDAEDAREESKAAQKQREEQRKAMEEYNRLVESHNRAVRMMDQTDQIMFHNQHQYLHTAQGDYEDAAYDISMWEWETQQSAKTAEETAAVHELAAAKMAAAWASAVDKIKQLNESIQDKIFHLMHNATENMLHDLQNETNKYLQQGADPGLVNQYYNLKQRDIVSKANNGQGPTGYHDVIVHDGRVSGESYGTGRDQIDIRPTSTAMQQIGSRMPQITEIMARIPAQNQQLINKMDTVYSKGTATATVGKRDVVDYNLNVNVTGLQDLNHQVAESAAKQILDKMPRNTTVNYGYAV